MSSGCRAKFRLTPDTWQRSRLDHGDFVAVKVQTSAKGQRRVLRQLRSAQHSLEQWSKRIRVSAVQGPAASSGKTSPHAMLLAVVELAKAKVDQRLNELHGCDPVRPHLAERTEVCPRPSRKQRSTLDVCLDACRACGRSLGAAFREAQAAADAVSAKILYVTLRELERLLWVLNPNQAH
jgi:hypothetical protein